MTSLYHIRVIEKFKSDQLLDEIEEHAYRWNIEKKCDCVSKNKEPTRENILICEHILEDRRKKFQKNIDERYQRAITLGKAGLMLKDC